MHATSRRQFLRESIHGVAAAAAGASVWTAPAVLPAGSPNNRVVLALMGGGGRGRDLILKFAALPDVFIKYVCDVEDARGNAVVGELAKIQGTAPEHVVDIRRVLDDRDVQGIVVATPEQWHALATVWACQAEKDMYVEKKCPRAPRLVRLLGLLRRQRVRRHSYAGSGPPGAGRPAAAQGRAMRRRPMAS